MISRRWILLLVATGLFLFSAIYVALHLRDALDTDILSLLPGDLQDVVVSNAMAQANVAASTRIVLAIEGGTPAARATAGQALLERLQATGLYESSDIEARAIWAWVFAHRSQLLCPEDRSLLLASRGQVITDQALRAWYAPATMGAGHFLESDPLLLTNRLIACLLPKSFSSMPTDQAVLITGRITAPVYSLDVQDAIAKAVSDWRLDPRAAGLTLSRAGTIFHATYGAAQARSEMTVLGSVTAVLIILLYWLVFGSLRAPLIALSMVGFSLTVGLAVTLIVFQHIHIIGLVFGAALMGLVVDYTTYYLTTHLDDRHHDETARLMHLAKPLTLGMLTSAGAFTALLFFPVPAFQQVALLGGAGLVVAWAATLLIMPYVPVGRLAAGPAARFLARGPAAYLATVPKGWHLIAVAIVACLLIVWGRGHLRMLDDVRQFQAPSSALVLEEQTIRSLTGFGPSGAFMLVRGASVDEVAMHEEAFLDALGVKGMNTTASWAASRLAPSERRRREDTALIQENLLTPYLAPYIQTLGGGDIAAYHAGPAAPFAEVPGIVSMLRGQSGDVYWSILPLDRFDRVSLPALNDNWQLVEPAMRYSTLFSHYRMLAIYGLLAAVVATGVFLLIVYRQISALLIMFPMVIALLTTPAICAAFGIPFSFFSAMGLFLVVGAGVDYAIFQNEHPDAIGKWTRVGLILAATMTCFSVGLLGLSSVLPVSSFGLTVGLGVFLSIFLSPLAKGWTRHTKTEETYRGR